MKNLFKISKENSNYQSPKTIPDDFFQDNTHSQISTISRLSPLFDQMLNLPSARQMFQRYLNSEGVRGIFACYRELRNVDHCNMNCQFDNRNCNDDIRDSINYIVDNINSSHDDKDLVIHRKKLENELLQRCKEMDNKLSCHFISLYVNYFSICAKQSSFDNSQLHQLVNYSQIAYKLLAELFTECHQKPLSSFQALQQCIYDTLSTNYYPKYLMSYHHNQYQYQLLDSGLNSLQLSDFIYSNEYIMIITEFLDMHGLVDYLGFLLAVINLSRPNGKCSFNDALDVHSRFLVMDSIHYIPLPCSITNTVVNQMCHFTIKQESSTDNNIDPNVIFQCAFRPIYLFLEQYWLPEFLICPTYQTCVQQLQRTIQISQTRHRHLSANTACNAPPPVMYESPVPEDHKTDIFSDNTSVQSEPAISIWPPIDNPPESLSNNHLWWPAERLEDRFSKNPIRRPMSLGSFDDLGRYHSFTTGKRQSLITNSTSSDILTTISELGTDLLNKLSVNETKPTTISPDDMARQIIKDVRGMILRPH